MGRLEEFVGRSGGGGREWEACILVLDESDESRWDG